MDNEDFHLDVLAFEQGQRCASNLMTPPSKRADWSEAGWCTGLKGSQPYSPRRNQSTPVSAFLLCSLHLRVAPASNSSARRQNAGPLNQTRLRGREIRALQSSGRGVASWRGQSGLAQLLSRPPAECRVMVVEQIWDLDQSLRVKLKFAKC